MNKAGLWIVVAVTAAWIGFLLGYSMSAHTGAKPAVAGAPAAASGGYGGSAPPAASGGYGGARPAVSRKPAAGGYGR
jgi:hypothetical protein